MTKGLDPWVGIHLRRGDFEERLVLPVADIKLKLMDIQKNRRVFIASNDPKAIDEFSEFNPIRINLKSFGYPAYIFDFLMLKDSEAIIGCGSTFSWWAAYLGNKDEYYSPPLTHLWQSWKDDVGMAEKILIYKYTPNYNSSEKGDYPKLKLFQRVKLTSQGNRHRLHRIDIAPDDYK